MVYRKTMQYKHLIIQTALQIIVIDHADEMTWQGIADVHVVERWRGGNALIPQDWLNSR